jgi:hypothetical protein
MAANCAFWPKTGIGERRPRQIFGICKRGGRYLRSLLIHGARTALGRDRDKQDPRSLWRRKMRQRRYPILSLSRSPTRMRGSPGLAYQRLRNKSAGTVTTCLFSPHASPSTTRPRGPIARPVCGRLAVRIAIGLRAPVRSRDRCHERVHASRRGSGATFPIIRPSRRSVVAAWQERPAAPSLLETVVARCMARDLRAAKLSRSTRVLSSPTPSAAGAWPRSATGFDVMLGLAQGEAKYGDLEKRLAYSRAITARCGALPMEGGVNGSPHPEPNPMLRCS